MTRDYELLRNLNAADDNTLIGVDEVGVLLNFSPVTVRAKWKTWRNVPTPIQTSYRLRWRLGDWRRWAGITQAEKSSLEASVRGESGGVKSRGGRPTKKEQVERSLPPLSS